MATFRVHGLAVTVLIAVLLAVGLQSEGRADYPGPRWFGGQAPSQLLHNCPPGPCNPADEFVVTNPESSSGYGLTHVQATLNAITDWNNALRGSPNSITKYPLHYNQMYDPNANVIVEMVDDTRPYCGERPGRGEPPGCNTLHHIYIDSTFQENYTELHRLIRHELGHSLWYSRYVLFRFSLREWTSAGRTFARYLRLDHGLRLLDL